MKRDRAAEPGVAAAAGAVEPSAPTEGRAIDGLDGAQIVGDSSTSTYLPPYRVDITVRGGVRVPVSRHRLALAVRAALEAAGAPGPASIGLILSDDAELERLNAVHMGHEGPTDVLSFPFFPPEAYPPHRTGEPPDRNPGVAAALKQAFALPPGLRAHLGEIIVSAERAAAQAASGTGGQTGKVRWTAADETLLLVVHGALHVCGWDHAAAVEEAAMRTLEREVLASLPGHEGYGAGLAASLPEA